MPKAKIAVTLESGLLEQVDALVQQRRFANRSQAIESAVSDQVARLQRTRLAEQCALLDPEEERALAEEGLAADLVDWPEY
jgi:metal-responsive CopG/Arc/MetJ family transcriptional regulator